MVAYGVGRQDRPRNGGGLCCCGVRGLGLRQASGVEGERSRYMVQHIVTWDGVDVDRRGLDCGMEGKKENMERDENRRERFFWFFWWWPWSSAAAPGRLAA